MSAELECSIDYLVNEAMRQYARSRNYGPRTSSMSVSSPGMPAATAPAAEAPSPRTTLPQHSVPVPTPKPAPAPAPPPAAPPLRAPAPAPPPLRASSGGMPVVTPPARPPSVPSMAPPPLPSAPPPVARPSPAPGQTLYVIFAGQKMPVLKDPFVIGRGSKTSDLAIKDGNISRKHALVTRHEGAFYMKDLGSTNGVLWNGRRIESKRIEEGDVYVICDYEIRFTYR